MTEDDLRPRNPVPHHPVWYALDRFAVRAVKVTKVSAKVLGLSVLIIGAGFMALVGMGALLLFVLGVL